MTRTGPEYRGGNCSGSGTRYLIKSLIYKEKGELAGEPGFEPRLTESESVVLPLNYSPAGAAGKWSGRCAALINKSWRIANTDFEKNRCCGGFLVMGPEKLESRVMTGG